MNQQAINNSAAASLIDRAFSQEYSYNSSILMLEAAAKLDQYVDVSELTSRLMVQWMNRESDKRKEFIK